MSTDVFHTIPKASDLNFTVNFSLWTGLHHTTLLGGEFANCHGQGHTPEQAVISLRLTVAALRRQKARDAKAAAERADVRG